MIERDGKLWELEDGQCALIDEMMLNTKYTASSLRGI